MKNDTIETTGKSDFSPFNVFDNEESQTVKATDVTRETSSTDTEEKTSSNQGKPRRIIITGVIANDNQS